MLTGEAKLPKMTDAQVMAQMKAALEEIRDKAAVMKNGGAWAAGIAGLCLGTLR